MLLEIRSDAFQTYYIEVELCNFITLAINECIVILNNNLDRHLYRIQYVFEFQSWTYMHQNLR